ncbi:lysine-specific demethylase JMJ17 isoform X2 [Cornus florida]|uniref:lysine-specific demethylase JMJ17 isoform X2 n=1 Tax=Cornus florida TaxID=4283 RepID=UPI00289931E6|nr:lysine-specific demethylase JMJ17 isoform X2 [Cornus florida]
MGKGKPRAVEKGVLGQNSSVLSSPGSLIIPQGPVYYPTEDEFKDPLEFIYKIRPEAEPYGICKIVPPKSWKPPFALDLDSFTFPTKTQAIHQLQVRPPPCDRKTFDLEYDSFLKEHCGRKVKKKVVFEGEELDICKLFNAVKRYGGYDKVVEGKKWGEVFRFVRSTRKISECAKHVLCQLYREHLYDYENYYNKAKSCKRGLHVERNSEPDFVFSSSKRRRKNMEGETVKACKIEEKVEELDQICEQCRSGLHGEVMLLCDRCNRGWHIYCLSPPLKQIPPGNWYCLECLNSDKDSFGFVPGKCFSLEAFRRVADRAKKKWFGSTSTSRVQLEKKFWEIVEGSVGEVEVMYGSDLDTSKYGSGFPRVNDQRPPSVEAELWDEYCASPWNINNLPKLQGSMLRAVPDSIAGVMVPWLYIGMLFSSFCWHFEDHCFYSMNYHHWGEPKCWYSVPGSEARAFEKVMRKSLPDLFDVQPDLLFQLVTMLNPSVLQENGVPVYSVLQEPGNFVITFPRSFHGGFNFGLNCAEAVNFAPADWLPHGGFGAELYQLYHKTAVLSHEELVCVVAKSDYDSKTLPYLREEFFRIYEKERTWRERLWRNGIVNSAPMSPRKHPEYVGTEEDPTCIICHQYLYLSAVVCRCRPSAFVCLQHWEHLCECKPKKHCLLYRHTLAELSDLVLKMDRYNSEETLQNRSLRRELLCSKSGALMKKVKGGHISLSELAEQWLLRSCKILQIPYSKDAYVNALKEAEQFLWAGSEMDPVRDVAKNLIEAQKWAENIKDCLSKVEKWSYHHCHDIEKVHLEHVTNLLCFNPLPCNEPKNLKLKNYEEKAGVLIQEIDSALSSCSKASITDWEVLYSKVRDFPIYLKDGEKLARKLSFAKVWLDSVKRCISEKHPATIEVDILYKLKSEISELQVQLPEADMLLDLIKLVESRRARCNEMLTGPINLKNLEVLLQDLDGCTVNIPELNLLRQYHSDAVSWLSRFNAVLMSVDEREDQEHVVEELICIQKDAMLLKIQVGELPCVEVELKKACCRVKALKALGTKMSLDFIQQLIMEATVLQIEKEKFFVDISGVLATAMCWEEKAVHILGSEAQMSDFEDVIRTSEDILVILPSLDVVKDAVSMTKSWLQKSKPYLEADLTVMRASSSLKELVSQSMLLKVSMGERTMLQTVLKNCIHWEHDAYSLLCDADCLLHSNTIGDGNTSDLTFKIEHIVAKINSIIKAGFSLHFEFAEIPKLQDACSTLQWCFKALSLCSIAPPPEEVEMLMQDAYHLPFTCASSALCSSLMDGINWLKKALEIPLLCNCRRFKLDDAKEILLQSQRLEVSFPVVVCQLGTAIEKHDLWLEKVHCFFSITSGDRSWFSLLQLKEIGSSDAFSCPELDMVLSEVQKVEQWKQCCKDIVGHSVLDINMLLNSLSEIETTLDRSLYIYGVSMGCKARDLCMCCSSGFEAQEFLTCSLCKDCYHLGCVGQAYTRDVTLFICPYCQLVEGGEYSRNGGGPMKFKGKRPELSKLIELLSDAEDFCVRIEERIIVCQLVEKALACKAYLKEIVDFVLDYLGEDLSTVAQKLSVALKAVETAGVHDHQGNCNFEMALARNSWRVTANKLLDCSQRPPILVIQCHLKEGLAISIPPEDHFMQKLTEVKNIGIQWADKAKKVSMDSGALALDKVFELITEGENLALHFEAELKLLRDRSLLYCICRKPYDQRAMIACDKCDEWYHFDCIKLSSPPKIYICPACKLKTEEDLSMSQLITAKSSTGGKFEEPQTPSPQRTELRRNLKNLEASAKRKMLVSADDSKQSRGSSVIECLMWRNRKPFRRSAKKRAELDCLSSFFHVQH